MLMLKKEYLGNGPGTLIGVLGRDPEAGAGWVDPERAKVLLEQGFAESVEDDAALVAVEALAQLSSERGGAADGDLTGGHGRPLRTRQKGGARGDHASA